jgi:hypothetical protein
MVKNRDANQFSFDLNENLIKFLKKKFKIKKEQFDEVSYHQRRYGID